MPRTRWPKPNRPMAGLSPEGLLAELLTRLFGAGGLRPFIAGRWPELDGLIYWERGQRDLSDQVVRVLNSRGYLDLAFFQALVEETGGRPQATRMVRRVARAWIGLDAAKLGGGDGDGEDDDSGAGDGGAGDGGAEDGGAEDGGAEDGGAEDGGAEDGGAEDEAAPAPAETQQAPPAQAPPEEAPRPWWRFAEEPELATLEIHLDPGALAPDSAAMAAGANLPCLYRCAAANIESGGSFTMPWGPAELAELRAALRGQAATPGAVGLRRWGLTLREALRGFDAVSGAVAGLPGLRLAIRTQRGALLLLPWELLPLHAGPGAQPVALEPGCSVVRQLRTLGLPRRQPVRADRGVLLFAWSASIARVPAEHHAGVLRALCEAHQIPFVELGGADLPGLFAKAQELNRAGTPVRAMHLLCHGKRLSADPELWGLALGTPQNPSTAEPGQLRTLLSNAMGALELLTIFACNAADGGEDANPLGSVAEAAYYAGVDVVAPTLPLSIPGSNLAVEALYRTLLEGGSLDGAMRDTVAQLQLAGAGLHDWAALGRLEPGRNP